MKCPPPEASPCCIKCNRVSTIIGPENNALVAGICGHRKIKEVTTKQKSESALSRTSVFSFKKDN